MVKAANIKAGLREMNMRKLGIFAAALLAGCGERADRLEGDGLVPCRRARPRGQRATGAGGGADARRRAARFDANGTYQVEQMYVQYFVPSNVRGNLPLLMWHGGGLTGVTYESTPDGR